MQVSSSPPRPDGQPPVVLERPADHFFEVGAVPRSGLQALERRRPRHRVARHRDVVREAGQGVDPDVVDLAAFDAGMNVVNVATCSARLRSGCERALEYADVNGPDRRIAVLVDPRDDQDVGGSVGPEGREAADEGSQDR
jgi:hypothetical protein